MKRLTIGNSKYNDNARLLDNTRINRKEHYVDLINNTSRDLASSYKITPNKYTSRDLASSYKITPNKYTKVISSDIMRKGTWLMTTMKTEKNYKRHGLPKQELIRTNKQNITLLNGTKSVISDENGNVHNNSSSHIMPNDMEAKARRNIIRALFKLYNITSNKHAYVINNNLIMPGEIDETATNTLLDKLFTSKNANVLNNNNMSIKVSNGTQSMKSIFPLFHNGSNEYVHSVDNRNFTHKGVNVTSITKTLKYHFPLTKNNNSDKHVNINDSIHMKPEEREVTIPRKNLAPINNVVPIEHSNVNNNNNNNNSSNISHIMPNHIEVRSRTNIIRALFKLYNITSNQHAYVIYNNPVMPNEIDETATNTLLGNKFPSNMVTSKENASTLNDTHNMPIKTAVSSGTQSAKGIFPIYHNTSNGYVHLADNNHITHKEIDVTGTTKTLKYNFPLNNDNIINANNNRNDSQNTSGDAVTNTTQSTRDLVPLKNTTPNKYPDVNNNSRIKPKDMKVESRVNTIKDLFSLYNITSNGYVYLISSSHIVPEEVNVTTTTKTPNSLAPLNSVTSSGHTNALNDTRKITEEVDVKNSTKSTRDLVPLYKSTSQELANVKGQAPLNILPKEYSKAISNNNHNMIRDLFALYNITSNEHVYLINNSHFLIQAIDVRRTIKTSTPIHQLNIDIANLATNSGHNLTKHGEVNTTGKTTKHLVSLKSINPRKHADVSNNNNMMLNGINGTIATTNATNFVPLYNISANVVAINNSNIIPKGIAYMTPIEGSKYLVSVRKSSSDEHANVLNARDIMPKYVDMKKTRLHHPINNQLQNGINKREMTKEVRNVTTRSTTDLLLSLNRIVSGQLASTTTPETSKFHLFLNKIISDEHANTRHIMPNELNTSKTYSRNVAPLFYSVDRTNLMMEKHLNEPKSDISNTDINFTKKRNSSIRQVSIKGEEVKFVPKNSTSHKSNSIEHKNDDANYTREEGVNKTGFNVFATNEVDNNIHTNLVFTNILHNKRYIDPIQTSSINSSEVSILQNRQHLESRNIPFRNISVIDHSRINSKLHVDKYNGSFSKTKDMYNDIGSSLVYHYLLQNFFRKPTSKNKQNGNQTTYKSFDEISIRKPLDTNQHLKPKNITLSNVTYYDGHLFKNRTITNHDILNAKVHVNKQDNRKTYSNVEIADILQNFFRNPPSKLNTYSNQPVQTQSKKESIRKLLQKRWHLESNNISVSNIDYGGGMKNKRTTNENMLNATLNMGKHNSIFIVINNDNTKRDAPRMSNRTSNSIASKIKRDILIGDKYALKDKISDTNSNLKPYSTFDNDLDKEGNFVDNYTLDLQNTQWKDTTNTTSAHGESGKASFNGLVSFNPLSDMNATLAKIIRKVNRHQPLRKNAKYLIKSILRLMKSINSPDITNALYKKESNPSDVPQELSKNRSASSTQEKSAINGPTTDRNASVILNDSLTEVNQMVKDHLLQRTALQHELTTGNNLPDLATLNDYDLRANQELSDVQQELSKNHSASSTQEKSAINGSAINRNTSVVLNDSLTEVNQMVKDHLLQRTALQNELTTGNNLPDLATLNDYDLRANQDPIVVAYEQPLKNEPSFEDYVIFPADQMLDIHPGPEISSYALGNTSHETLNDLKQHNNRALQTTPILLKNNSVVGTIQHPLQKLPSDEFKSSQSANFNLSQHENTTMLAHNNIGINVNDTLTINDKLNYIQNLAIMDSENEISKDKIPHGREHQINTSKIMLFPKSNSESNDEVSME